MLIMYIGQVAVRQGEAKRRKVKAGEAEDVIQHPQLAVKHRAGLNRPVQ